MNRKMNIVVIGGTGVIGTRVVNNLRQQGHKVVAAAPSTGVDVITGAGLTAALDDSQVVIDVANSPSCDANEALQFFTTAGRNLLTAEANAGVKHHVALTVVATDRLLACDYFRAKMVQENLIRGSFLPYSIVRATQFFEFLPEIAQSAGEGKIVRLPPVRSQPIAADDVTRALADVALRPPLNGTVEIAGPDTIRLDDLVRRFLRATHDDRLVIADAKTLYFGARLSDYSLTPGPDPRLGLIHFEDWLSRQRSKYDELNGEKVLAQARRANAHICRDL